MSRPTESSRLRSRLGSRRAAVAATVLTVLSITAVFGGPSMAAIDDAMNVSADSAPAPKKTAPPEPAALTSDADEDVDVKKAVVAAKKRAAKPPVDYSKLTMEELQAKSAEMQAEFVSASLAYEAAKTESDQATVAAHEADIESERAKVLAAKARDTFGAQVADSYARGIGSNTTMKILAGGDTTIDDVYDEFMATVQVNTAQSIAVDKMKAISEAAAALAAKAKRLRAAADKAEKNAQILLDDIQTRAADVAEAANKALTNSADGRTLFASAEQTARNAAALKHWQEYLATLKKARVVPPVASSLLNAKKLPRGLTPLRGNTETPVIGVAAKKYAGETITVLPSETIAAVSRAFSAVGKPFVAHNSGPETYDCSGLAAGVWDQSKYGVPNVNPVGQFRNLKTVPLGNMQVGDLVFFADKADGIQHLGVNLGGSLMLTSDAVSNQVGVQEFPEKAFGAARVTLPRNKAGNNTPRTDVTSFRRCGGAPVAESSGSGMIYPIKKGTYSMSAGFGKSGGLWSSGSHTGQDFAAPIGTPVMAAKAGVVTVSSVGWAGPNFVTIDHGAGLKTAYGHMSQAIVKTGQKVAQGQLVGAVGSEGNSTGPHLHFEVIMSGVQIDPMLFLAGTGMSSGAGWGGFKNGMIPSTATCPLVSGPGHRLRCDSAAAWNALASAYAKSMKSKLCIADSYRSYALQVTTYASKPGLAAVPGTSNHGWALAVDLCGGIERFGSPQHKWMVANAPRFGWKHPSWARQGGGREEAWHWEFGNIS